MYELMYHFSVTATVLGNFHILYMGILSPIVQSKNRSITWFI